MSEPMATWSEWWLLAADSTPDPDTGIPGTIWLPTGGRIEPAMVYADGDPWTTAKQGLAGIGVVDPADDLFVRRPGGPGDLVFIHGTSGRPDDGRWLVTHMAVAEVAGGDVLARWPNAQPITRDVLDYVGKPFPHGPTTAPVPRDFDVVTHGTGHLAYLRDTNGEWQDVLATRPSGQWWINALEPIAPVLARQYTHHERAVWRAAHPAAVA